MLTIELNMYHAVALGAFLFWMGGIITDKVRLLNRYCIPAPLIGGLCFSVLNCILYSAGIASVTFDSTLQTVFMIMFFTTVGFTVSIPALLKGGKAVVLCLIVSVVMIPLQNFLGGGVMEVFGRDSLLGIGCGSIALIGGPGTAAAFGPDLEAAGAVGGSVVSIAAATFGLVAGSLMGGPTARRVIENIICARRRWLPSAARRASALPLMWRVKTSGLSQTVLALSRASCCSCWRSASEIKSACGSRH